MYGGTMWLVQDDKTWQRCIAYLGCETRGAARGKAFAAQHKQTGELVYLIGVFDGGLSTLVHECAHLAFWILRDVGIKLQGGKTNESYCYLIQTLFELFYPYLKEPA